MRGLSFAVVVLAALGAAIGCGGADGQRAPVPRPAAVATSRTSHVAIVVMENKDYDQVIGSRSAPYINRLARRFTLASASYGIRHPSLPNYLALTGGSTFSITSDCTSCTVGAGNLVDQLERAGVTWRGYMQGMPHACFLGAAADRYAKKHDPFVYYRDIARSHRQCSRVVPLTRLGSDLRNRRLPAFVWISPDLCDDMHDCGVSTGDRFLRSLVPSLLRALGPHGFIVVTWDEGSAGSRQGCCRLARGGRIATILAGPDVRRGFRLRTPIDHYSVLRAVEDAFGLGRLRAAACPCTRSLRAAFKRRQRLRGG